MPMISTKRPVIKSVDVTPPGSPTDRKWTSYQIDGVEIGLAMKFRCSGKYNYGKIGRSFDWNHTNLEQFFGAEYHKNRELFNWRTPSLVFSAGGTIPLTKIKKIISTVSNNQQ